MDDPGWLVKDFNVLYRAASAAIDAERRSGHFPITLAFLAGQLDRLRPAFELTEGVRAGTPASLAVGSRFARLVESWREEANRPSESACKRDTLERCASMVEHNAGAIERGLLGLAQGWRDHAFGSQHMTKIRSDAFERCAAELDAFVLGKELENAG